VNLSTIESVVEPLAEGGPLDDGGDQKKGSHCAVAVLLQKGHQEDETDEHHDVDILEHYAKQKAIKYKNSNRPKKN
jgi:hypothetical protein